jgi:hypothetical protein
MLFEPSHGADRRQLRQFAAALIAFATIALALRWRRHGQLSAPVAMAAVVAYILGVAGIVAPRTIAWLYATVSAVTQPIGRVLSEVMLLILYFGVVTPIALLCRLAGRDRLQRRFDRRNASHWVPSRASSEIARYFRQS